MAPLSVACFLAWIDGFVVRSSSAVAVGAAIQARFFDLVTLPEASPPSAYGSQTQRFSG
jgi:hypothetical protein